MVVRINSSFTIPYKGQLTYKTLMYLLFTFENESLSELFFESNNETMDFYIKNFSV